MSDMKKPARVLELDVAIDATPEEVWKAITEAARVANWFAPDVTGDGSGVGSTLTISWGGGIEFTTTIGRSAPPSPGAASGTTGPIRPRSFRA